MHMKLVLERVLAKRLIGPTQPEKEFREEKPERPEKEARSR